VRKLLIALVVLAGVLVAADYGLRLYSQSVVADELQSSLKLSEKPSVSFGGWPFITHVISGDLPSATVSAHEATAAGVRLERLSITLRDLTFSAKRLITRGGGEIRAKSGDGTALMTSADIDDALAHAGAPFRITIANGRATVSSGGLHVGVEVKLEGDSVVLTPASTAAVSARIPLPTLTKGVHYSALQLEGSRAMLTISIRNAVFELLSTR
jgi:LmeA-like phospholipid-binding